MSERAPAPVARLLEAANANDTEAFLETFVDGDGFIGPSHFSFLVEADRVSRMTIRA